MKIAVSNPTQRARRRAAPMRARRPSGARPMYPSDEGQT